MSASDSPVTIRPFEGGDIDATNALLTTHWPWTEYETRFEFAVEDIMGTGEALVASVNDSFAGLVWWLPTGAFDQSGYLKLLGVHRDHQSAGVGTALMDAMETAVFEGVGASDLFLLASGFNKDAKSFYRRRDYDQVGTIDAYVEPGIDEVLMRKTRPDC